MSLFSSMSERGSKLPGESSDGRMKYVLIVPSGMSDGPVDELDGLTPMQAANLPNLGALAAKGRVGTVRTIPDGISPSSQAGLLTILGYDSDSEHAGRANFSAIPLHVENEEYDWLLSFCFVTIDPDGDELLFPTAGIIEPTEARLLIESLSEAIGDEFGDEDINLEFFTGHGHEHVLIDHSGSHYYDDLMTVPATELVGQSVRKFLPHGATLSRRESKETARFLNRIMDLSKRVFAEHEVNRTRRELGDPVATQVWIWEPCRREELIPFKKRFPGMRCALVTADDLAAGIASAAGWDRLDIYDDSSRITAHLRSGGDTINERMICDIRDRAVRAIHSREYDIITIYLREAGDVSLGGDFAGKITVLELIDREIVGPVLEALRESTGGDDGKWRLIVVPELSTLTQEQRHDVRPVPFVIAGSQVTSVVHFDAFHEAAADEADLHIESGSDFLEYALYNGLRTRQ